MTKVPYNGQPYAGAQVAAYIGAQSVIQRLNAVVPGRWRQQFQSIPAEFVPAGTRRVYLACRLIVTLPVEDGGPDVDAVYEDLGEMDSGSLAGVKALYSDARKRAAVAAGIGAYLYTSLEAVVLPIGPHARQVQAIRRQGKSDLLVLSAETEQWLRHGYQTRMSTEAVRRDLGEILAHGEPENGHRPGRGRRPGRPTPRRAARQRAGRPGDATGTARWSPSTSATSDRRRRDEPPTSSAPPAGRGARRRSRAPAQLAARIQIPRRLRRATTASRSSTCRTRATTASSSARRTGAGATCSARRPRRPGRCSSAARSTTRSRSTTGTSSTTASASPSTRSTTRSGTGWKSRREAEREQLGIAWETDLREDGAFKLGLDAVELTFSELIPRLGEPVAVQRKVEYTLAPGLEWSVLVLPRPRDPTAPTTGERATRPSSTTRCKTTRYDPVQGRTDDFQPAVYLAGRWLEGDPAARVLLRSDRASPVYVGFPHIPGYVAPGTMLLPTLAAMRSRGGRCRIGRAVGVEMR